jgi:hypothetical protein
VALAVGLMRNNVLPEFADAIFGLRQATVSQRGDPLYPLIAAVLAEFVPHPGTVVGRGTRSYLFHRGPARECYKKDKSQQGAVRTPRSACGRPAADPGGETDRDPHPAQRLHQRRSSPAVTRTIARPG